MDRLFFDTNVILDVLEKRTPWFPESLKCLSLAKTGTCTGAVTAITLSDIAYIQSGTSVTDLYTAFQRLRAFLEIAELGAGVVDHALDRQLQDVEDGFQLASAIGWKATHLLTRNVKDFPRKVSLHIITPTEYLNTLPKE